MKILAISTLFPNPEQRQHGVFLEHRLRWLAKEPDLEIKVIAPVPWFPSGSGRFGQYAKFAKIPAVTRTGGLDVSHPRYFLLPKISMSLAPWLLLVALIKQARALRAGGFDFDVIDAYYLYPDGVASIILGKILKRPVVLTAFGSDVTVLPRYRLPKLQIGWALRSACAVTAVCNALRQDIHERFSASVPVQVVYHGVDLDLFRPSLDRDSLRKSLKMTGFTLVSVGSLIPRKGHHIAIAGMAQVPDAALYIAGAGSMRAELQALASKLGVADRVHFLGEINQSMVCAYLAAADALALCSDREGLANVMMESLACGTPVISTEVWGAPEVIESGKNGVLFADRTPAGFATAVQAFRAQPPSRHLARRTAERFSWETTASAHRHLLQHALAVWRSA